MTVSITTIKDQNVGTGANTPQSTTFKFGASSEIKVTSRVTATGDETVLTLGTHYTVSGGGTPLATGTITPVDGATDYPSTVTWTISRVTPITQATDYGENDNFAAETHEGALDKLTHIVQESDDKFKRALSIPISDDDGVTPLDMELPNKVERASKYSAYNTDGEPIAADAPVETIVATTFGNSLVDDENAAEGRATLDAQEDVIATKGGVVIGDASGDAEELNVARGSLLRGAAAGGAEELTIGAANAFMQSDGTDAAWAALDLESLLTLVPYPRGHLKGLGATRASSTNISIAEGQCRAGSAANQNLINGVNAAAFTKDFVAGWSVGTGGNGVITGALAAAIDDWHYFMLVGTDGSVDFGYDTDIGAANLIADAAVQAALTATVYFRRLFSFRSDATPVIADFTQIGDRFLLTVPVLVHTATADYTTATNIALASATGSGIPGGINTVGMLRVATDDQTANQPLAIGAAVETLAGAPSLTVAPLGNIAVIDAGDAAFAELYLDVNTSRQIRVKQLTDNSIDLHIVARGYIDRRGQDD